MLKACRVRFSKESDGAKMGEVKVHLGREGSTSAFVSQWNKGPKTTAQG
jgi:hypothetical protein